MPITIDFAVAKTNKHASRESGDTVEIVERPGGGLSVIMADGQGSGRAAKTLSLLVTAKVAALLKEGVRDGACARAANDFLFAMRHGQVSATLDILSVDLKTRTVVITRNGDSPCLVAACCSVDLMQSSQGPIGVHARTRPWTAELPIEPGRQVIVVSDGITHSGHRTGLPPLDLVDLCASVAGPTSAAAMADHILNAAVHRDGGKPGDDMSVVVLNLTEHDEQLLVRRMRAEVPLP
jgi:serine phosphatase RsbU (regulator of sigma subunit)